MSYAKCILRVHLALMIVNTDYDNVLLRKKSSFSSMSAYRDITFLLLLFTLLTLTGRIFGYYCNII